jgi:hypothetical protein
VLAQCLDIVLGAIAFRLNDKHKEIPDGQNRRKRHAKHLLNVGEEVEVPPGSGSGRQGF